MADKRPIDANALYEDVSRMADEWERTRKAQRNGRRYCADDSGCTHH